jgi:Ca2+/Na+ antiporter
MISSQGNGAPDIFSIVAGVSSGSSGIGLGIPIGAGVFVTTVVMGACFASSLLLTMSPSPLRKENAAH